MKILKLVALLVAVISVSGIPHMLKDAEREYLKRAIIRNVKEKFEQQIVAAPNDFKTDEDLDAIIPQINADTTSAEDIKEEDASPRCTLSAGVNMDKKGDLHKLRMGWVYSNAECVEICLTEQKSNSNITGLTVYRNDLRRKPNLHCSCSRGAVERVYFLWMGNSSHSCIFTPVTADLSKDVRINHIINGKAANSKLAELDAIMLETKDAMKSSTEVVSKEDHSSVFDCTLVNGYAGYAEHAAGNVMKMGWMDRDDCIKACLEKKKTIPSISAISTYDYYASNKQNGLCNCVKGSDVKITTWPEDWQSCILKPMPVYGCSLVVGYAEPALFYMYNTIHSGYNMLRSECVRICLEKKKSMPSISGVQTIIHDSDGTGTCICFKGPNVKIDTTTNSIYQYCIIKPISGDALM